MRVFEDTTEAGGEIEGVGELGLDLNPDLACDLGLNLFLFHSFFSVIVDLQKSCRYTAQDRKFPYVLYLAPSNVSILRHHGMFIKT